MGYLTIVIENLKTNTPHELSEIWQEKEIPPQDSVNFTVDTDELTPDQKEDLLSFDRHPDLDVTSFTPTGKEDNTFDQSLEPSNAARYIGFDPNNSLLSGENLQDALDELSSTVFNEVVGEEPTGAIDGTNKKFTLNHNPIQGTVELKKNGLTEIQGTNKDYEVSGDTLILSEAPLPGDDLTVNYKY